ncbi:MAG: hypothetical protein D6732_14505 [Methanobacteriota archaeon]|nr:MAG: hypothetical protein D6732_14505 [Euryarchaeota archaeon]
MPKEISPDEVNEDLIKRTSRITAVRSGNKIKYKLRTPRNLYTVVFSEEAQAEGLIKLANQYNVEIESISVRK